MAEGTGEDNRGWESWFGGWVQVAKEKSNTAYEFVKKDLAEFSNTIQKETEKAIEKTSSSLTRENTEQATTKVKAGISSFLSNVSRALVIPPSDDYVPVKVSADGSTLYDRGKARLHAIQLDASTYVDPPRGSTEQFEMWLNSFDMDQHKGEISEILVSKVEVRALYTKLVPNEVSHAEFWQRYFYRVHQMECDEARKQALMQRADRTHGDSLSWDEDDWSGGEEDEGHESDWEKMPRPQHHISNPSSETEKVSPPSHPSTNDINSPRTCISTDDPHTQNPMETQKKDNITKYEHPNLLLQVSSSPESNGQNSTPFSTENNNPSDSELETVHNHFSADSSSHAPKDVSATVANPGSRLQDAETEISADTASACKSAPDQVPCPQSVQGPESGSSAETPSTCDERVGDVGDSVLLHPNDGNPGASSAAAASGFESPDLSEGRDTGMMGDAAACGASDITSPPSLSSSSTTLPDTSNSVSPRTTSMPSSASKAEPSKEKSFTPSNAESQQTCASSKSNIDAAQLPAELDTGSGGVVKTSNDDDHAADLAMRIKGDMVVVGETDTPSTGSSEAKGLDDDWEEDFDVEVTEEDLKAAEDIARKLGENLDTEDDWENWD